MTCHHHVSPALALVFIFSASAGAGVDTVDVPCLKNLVDGRVLVDGPTWDRKMHELGYHLADGAFVPYEVLSFRQQAVHDAIWADGMCRMKLLPVAK